MHRDEEAKLVITLKPIYLERFIYWLIIIILAGFLINAALKDCEPADKKTTTTDTPTAAVTDTTPDGVPLVAEPAESCSDGLKNQNETDIDCGGNCDGCTIGMACETADDCVAKFCVDDACAAEEPVTLTGKVTLKLTDVDFTENNSTNAVKVTSLTYSLENGMDDKLGPLLFKVFLKSKRDSSYCLNQPDGDEIDCMDSYASFNALAPSSGDKITADVELAGLYTGASYVANYGSTTYYEHGDDFNLFLYLYDESGNLIDDKTISAFRLVSP